MKKLLLRALAEADIVTALDYYQASAPEYTSDFIDDIENAFRHIQKFPATGSGRYAYELNLPNLRTWGCRRFPYLIFYVEQLLHVEVLRVLHSKKDIPSSLQAE